MRNGKRNSWKNWTEKILKQNKAYKRRQEI